MSKGILRIVALFLFIFCNEFVSAQSTIIGQNAFWGTNTYGPMTSDATRATFFSRHAYIYPSSTLGNLKHGDTIRSVEFYKSSADTFRGSPNFKIYLNNSLLGNYGPSRIHWPNRTTVTGCKKVFDGNPKAIAGNSIGWKRFDFNSYYVFDTTRGDHLEILVEYIQDSAQNAMISWVYENNFSVPGFISNDEGKFVFNASAPTDSTVNSNLRKPYIKINYFRHQNNLEVQNVYCLGQIPILMGAPDTVKAIVLNSGLAKVIKPKIYLKVSGANTFVDSLFLDSLAPHQSQMVKFGSYIPSNTGIETVSVVVENDNYALDDSNGVRRIVNYNVYGHADPFEPIAGGIGFNGSSGDFVAKFFTDSIRYINQVKVEFSGGGEPFQVGIWEAAADGTPGKNIYSSDTFRSVPGNYILPLLPRIKIDGPFFVGIRQDSLRNIGFGYQQESPVRPDAFYFAAPLGDPDWTPFSPGFDFKFNIQPRIQVGNDVAFLRIDYPKSGDTVEYNQFANIGPSATLINFGFNSQSAPFDVHCEIFNQSGQKVYSSSKTVTIKANDTLKVQFDSTFSLNNLGPFKVLVYSNLHSDQIRDNDSLESNFEIVIRSDVFIERFFSPSAGSVYEMNLDSIWPVIRVVNNGISDHKNVRVTLQLKKDNKVLRSQFRLFDLPGKQSIIIDFDTVTIPSDGFVTFEAFLTNHIDSFPIDDTTRVIVEVQKANDLGIIQIKRPTHLQRYALKDRFQPFVDIRNYGSKDQDSVRVFAIIFDSKKKLVYRDSVLLSLTKFSTTQSIFKYFDCPDSVENYRLLCFTRIKGDQDRSNDSLWADFFVVRKLDLAISYLSPETDEVLLATEVISPLVIIENLGQSNLTDSPMVYLKIERDKGLVYVDSIRLKPGFEAGSFEILNFQDFTNTEVIGSYHAITWCKMAGDVFRSNDTMRSFFRISPKYNLSLGEAIEPVDSQFFEMNEDLIRPLLSISNTGYSDVTDSTTISIQSDVFPYLSTIKVGPIKRSERLEVRMPDTLILTENTNTTLSYQLVNAQDQFSSDDSGTVFVQTRKSHDVAAERLLSPSATEYYNLKLYPNGIFKNFGLVNENTEFSVSFEIYKDNILQFNSNRNITIAKGDSISVAFDTVFFPKQIGQYETLLISRLGTDQDKRNDSLKSVFDVVHGVGIDELKQQQISLSPNPTSDVIQVRFDGDIYTEIALLDMQGKILRQFTNRERLISIDLKEFARGSYLIRLTNGTQSLTQQVILY